MPKRLVLWLLALLSVACLSAVPAVRTEAASRPVRITECKMTSAMKVKVVAKLYNNKAVPGKKCYVFAVPFSSARIPSGSKPIQVKKKAKTMTFSFRLKDVKNASGLQVSASMIEDAVELNVRYSVLNIDLSVMISAKDEQNKNVSYAFKYNGKTWRFWLNVMLPLLKNMDGSPTGS